MDGGDDITKSLQGHRQRIRARFMASQVTSFTDYEFLEMLLFLAKPRGDTKFTAKKLVKDFGSLAKVIYASPEQLQNVENIGPASIYLFKLIQGIINQVQKKTIEKKVILQSWSSLIDYLILSQGQFGTEQFRILFLNTKNILIADEMQANGTLDQTAVYPREIVKKALYYNANSLILVHNHPSGSTKPSQADIDMTKKIIAACSTVNITVHDHVIVTADNFFSFKTNLMI